MHAVRARVCYLGEEAGGQLALDVEVPLLDVSVLWVAVSIQPVIRCQRWAVLRCHKARYVGCGYVGGAGRQSGEVAAGRQDDPTRTKRTRLTADWNARSGPKSAVCSIQGAEWGEISVGSCREIGISKIHNIVVWVQTERDVIRNEEDAVTTADRGFLVQTVGEAQAWRECLLVHRNIVTAAVASTFHQEGIAGAGAARATGYRCIGRAGIKVAQPVVGLGPSSLQFVAET